MVEVEERGLRALEEDVLAGGERVVHERDGVGDHRLDARRQLAEVAVGDVVGRQRQPVVHLGQHKVLLLEHHLELLAEDLRVEQVLHPQAHARRLVRVGGPDPPFGRAQRGLAEEALGDAVELLVVRHDQVGVAAHLQPGAIDAARLEAVDLLDQHRGVDDDAVADDGRDERVEDAARHELERERLTVDDDGVPGVVAALVPDDHRHLLGEEVGELALPLVAPLGADDNRRGHARLLRNCSTAVQPAYFRLNSPSATSTLTVDPSA